VFATGNKRRREARVVVLFDLGPGMSMLKGKEDNFAVSVFVFGSMSPSSDPKAGPLSCWFWRIVLLLLTVTALCVPPYHTTPPYRTSTMYCTYQGTARHEEEGLLIVTLLRRQTQE
jgi:hypothetical protein